MFNNLFYFLFAILCFLGSTYSLSTVYNMYPSGLFIMYYGVFGLLGFVLFIVNQVHIVKHYFFLYCITILLILFYCFNIVVFNVRFSEIYMFFRETSFVLFAFWFLYFTFNEARLKKIKSIIEKLFILQIPVLLIQFVYYKNLYQGAAQGVAEDKVVALLGSQMTGLIGLFSVFIGINLIESYMKKPSIKKIIGLIFVFIVQFAVSAKVTIFFWIVGIIFISMHKKIRFNIRNIFIILLLIIVLLNSSAIFGKDNLISKKYFDLYSIQLNNLNNNMTNSRLSRITTIIVTTNYLNNSEFNSLFGNGIGTTRIANQFNFYGRYYDLFTSPEYLGLSDNSFNPLYFESGIIGILLLFLYFAFFVKGKIPNTDKFRIATFFVMMFYTRSFDASFFTIYIAVIMSLILGYYKQEKDTRLNTNHSLLKG